MGAEEPGAVSPSGLSREELEARVVALESTVARLEALVERLEAITIRLANSENPAPPAPSEPPPVPGWMTEVLSAEDPGAGTPRRGIFQDAPGVVTLPVDPDATEQKPSADPETHVEQADRFLHWLLHGNRPPGAGDTVPEG